MKDAVVIEVKEVGRRNWSSRSIDGKSRKSIESSHARRDKKDPEVNASACCS
jgi:hypothetical protein